VSTGIGSEISKADHVTIRCYTAQLTSKPPWLLTNELKKEATPPDTNGVTYDYSTTHFQNEMRARVRWQVSHFYDILASRHRREQLTKSAGCSPETTWHGLWRRKRQCFSKARIPPQATHSTRSNISGKTTARAELREVEPGWCPACLAQQVLTKWDKTLWPMSLRWISPQMS